MTVQELIDELECCDGEAEVRFLAQPSWPFEYMIAAVVDATDQPVHLSGHRETPNKRVLLVEGRQACYGDQRAFEAAGERVVAVGDDPHPTHPRRSRAARETSAGPRLPRRRSTRPLSNDEEKEATTMAKQQAAKRVSAKQVAIDVLRAADEPLKAKEIAKRVIESGRCSGLKGKTPEATISAMLAVGSKPGGPFKRVDKGTYTLAATTSAISTPAAQAKPATAKKRAQPRKPAQAQTPKRQRTKPRPSQSR